MNLFCKLILQVFKTYNEQVSVTSNNTSYSYKDILTKVYLLTKCLKVINPTQMRVGLIANNSIEWIIAFLAIILSGNKLVLFSPLLSKPKLRHVILNAQVDILFTDHESFLKVAKMNTIVILIDEITNIVTDTSKEFTDIDIATTAFQNKNNALHITVYTPRSMHPVNISYESILKVLDAVGKARIFDKTSNTYVAYPEFTYNYILGLLLPFIEGVHIIIPKIQFTEYSAKWYLSLYKPGVVILNAYQFETLWRSFIEEPTNELMKFLTECNLRFVKMWFIKRNIKKVFPGMKKLIILNSSISTRTESILKSLKIPYTITYGSVETCGLTTYSDPKDFKPGTVGKIINPTTEYIHSSSTILIQHSGHSTTIDDIIKMDSKNNIIFLNRDDEIIETEFGFLITRDVEKILKGLPLINDCVLVKYNNSLILLVNIDTLCADTYNMNLSEVKKKLEFCRNELNSKVHTFEKIERIVIELAEFKRDGYGRILREYYTLD